MKSWGLKHNTHQIQLCLRSPSLFFCLVNGKKFQKTQEFPACQHPAVICLLLAPRCSTWVGNLAPSVLPHSPREAGIQKRAICRGFPGCAQLLLSLHFPPVAPSTGEKASGAPQGTLRDLQILIKQPCKTPRPNPAASSFPCNPSQSDKPHRTNAQGKTQSSGF